MKPLKLLTTVIVLTLISITMNAQQWETPIINSYGKIKDFKDASLQPDKNKEYKILFHITSDKEKEGVNASLWHIARQINLFGASGVPKHNVNIVAVVSGPATPLVLSDAGYKKKFNKSNPNLDLMKKLTDYGVKIEVCGQAAAENDIDPYKELNSYTELTLSALIDIPTYQMRGYSVMF